MTVKIRTTPTFRQALEAAHQVFIFLVIVYASILMTVGFSLQGQIRDGDLDRRVAVIESENIEHRLTVMETILADMKNTATLTQLNMGGTGLLIAEAVYRAIRRYTGMDDTRKNERNDL